MKNKIFVITFIFIMLLCSTCFATDYEDTRIADYDYSKISSNGLDFLSTCLNVAYDKTGIDYTNYVLAFNNTDNTYYFIACIVPCYYSDRIFSLHCSQNVLWIKKTSDDYIIRHATYPNPDSYYNFTLGNEFLYSSYDIYTGKDNTGDLVFQQTPLTILEAVEKTIIQTIPVMKAKIMETLGTLVPIVILVLSTLSVIYLIRLVISRAG